MGDELLLGDTVDTNAAWLGRRLAELGMPVRRRLTVGDEAEAIRGAVLAAMEDVDLVLVTGGLGPTADDLTRPAVAALLGRPIAVDEELLARLRAYVERRGYPFPESNRTQAEVPEGAIVLANPNGTAPGLAMDEGDCLVVLLPGIPRELRGIVDGDLGDLLRTRFEGRAVPVRTRLIHTTGVAESALAERVEEALPDDLGPVRIAFLPDLRGVDLRLTATGVGQGEARRWFDRIEEALEPAISGARYRAAGGDLSEALLAALRERALTVALAESCTGGLVSKRLTDVAGSSDVVVGGVVAYRNDVKVRQLGVDPGALELEGAVSEAVATQMAKGVAERLGASSAIAVTGVAGPGGGTADKPVGTVWLAALVGDRVTARRVWLPGDREAVRERTAQAALALLYRSVVRPAVLEQ